MLRTFEPPADQTASNCAEILLRIHRSCQVCKRRGCASPFELSDYMADLSHRLGTAPDVLKLRALVEDWVMTQIEVELSKVENQHEVQNRV